MLFQNDCLRSSYMCWRVFCVKPCIYDIHVCTLARVSLEFYYFINVIKCSKTAESLVLEDSGTISRKCSNINSRCTVALSTHNTHTKKTHTVMRGKHHGIKHSQTQKRKKKTSFAICLCSLDGHHHSILHFDACCPVVRQSGESQVKIRPTFRLWHKSWAKPCRLMYTFALLSFKLTF